MNYTVIYESTATGYSAYVPDLPGCIAAGATRAETERLIQSALRDHVAMLRELGYNRCRSPTGPGPAELGLAKPCEPQHCRDRARVLLARSFASNRLTPELASVQQCPPEPSRAHGTFDVFLRPTTSHES
jgi:predicted RNase H-like HicB family nuclease